MREASTEGSFGGIVAVPLTQVAWAGVLNTGPARTAGSLSVGVALGGSATPASPALDPWPRPPDPPCDGSAHDHSPSLPPGPTGARLGMALAGILGARPCHALDGLGEVQHAVPPEPLAWLTGLGALVVNLTCAFMLARYRHHSSSLTRAAFLGRKSPANVVIVAAGSYGRPLAAAWPDLIVGLGIAAMNADGAREVWTAAREEHRAAVVL